MPCFCVFLLENFYIFGGLFPWNPSVYLIYSKPCCPARMNQTTPPRKTPPNRRLKTQAHRRKIPRRHRTTLVWISWQSTTNAPVASTKNRKILWLFKIKLSPKAKLFGDFSIRRFINHSAFSPCRRLIFCQFTYP